MSEMIARPDIRNIAIFPNPAKAGNAFAIAIEIAEIVAAPVPEARYFGTLYLGEGDPP